MSRWFSADVPKNSTWAETGRLRILTRRKTVVGNLGFTGFPTNTGFRQVFVRNGCCPRWARCEGRTHNRLSQWWHTQRPSGIGPNANSQEKRCVRTTTFFPSIFTPNLPYPIDSAPAVQFQQPSVLSTFSQNRSSTGRGCGAISAPPDRCTSPQSRERSACTLSRSSDPRRKSLKHRARAAPRTSRRS